MSYINKYSKQGKKDKSSNKKSKKISKKNKTPHSVHLLNLLYQWVIMRGRIPLQQTIEEVVINCHKTDNLLLFTSSVEGGI